MSSSQKFLWVCQLTAEQPTKKWSPADLVDLEDEDDTDFLINSLILKTAVLGSKAVDGQRNLVAIRTKDHQEVEFEQPIFSLTYGKTDMVSGLDLTLTYDRNQEVEFKLIEGTGPVFITCTHLVEMPTADEQQTVLTTSDGDLEESCEDENEIEEDAENGEDAATKIKNGLKKANGAANGGEKNGIECAADKQSAKRRRN
jgi:hypothetical protein